jgi:hypothetical protein
MNPFIAALCSLLFKDADVISQREPRSARPAPPTRPRRTGGFAEIAPDDLPSGDLPPEGPPPIDLRQFVDLRSVTPLAGRAVDALIDAAQMPANRAAIPDERAVYRPDSWLVQRCWETLADAGDAEAAAYVAALAADRQPTAQTQTLHRLALQIDRRIGLAAEVEKQLHVLLPRLLTESGLDPQRHAERLLFAASAAARIGQRYLAFALLERLDQLGKQPWERLIINPDQRTVLADTVNRIGLHPLTVSLIGHALRRYGEAGAQFVLQLTTAATLQLKRPQPNPRAARMLELGVDTFRYATLTSLNSRRLTAIVFAQAGLVDDVLAQLTAIANIQAARRDSGLALRKGDPSVLRQVKRPTADADIDFQAYTLQEAVRAMPLRVIPREQRVELANMLAALGGRSDGWTAAAAAGTLVELGAVQYAVDVIERIPVTDPTRAEGVISLVRGLLNIKEVQLADEQVEKAVMWAQGYNGRTPERALIWGLVGVFLERREPEKALALIERFTDSSGWFSRMQGLFGRRVNDDELRNMGLRLRALAQAEGATPKELAKLTAEIRLWAPRLLEGEALVNFQLENLLRPLLETGRVRAAMALLPDVQLALSASTGEKHAARILTVAKLLADEVLPTTDDDGEQTTVTPELRSALENFVLGLWKGDTSRGVWQTVHGIEGTLPLVVALEGPQALIDIAKATLRRRQPGSRRPGGRSP